MRASAGHLSTARQLNALVAEKQAFTVLRRCRKNALKLGPPQANMGLASVQQLVVEFV